MEMINAAMSTGTALRLSSFKENFLTGITFAKVENKQNRILFLLHQR